MICLSVWGLIIATILALTSTSDGCSPEGLRNLQQLMETEQDDIQPAQTNRQWIFPSLKFTCDVILTGWAFVETSSEVVCPTIQLWNEATLTPMIHTDYSLTTQLIPENYTEPSRLSGIVYNCSLHTPVVVSAGTSIGFLTRTQSDSFPKSNLQVLQDDNLVGYYRGIDSASTFINTVFTAQIQYSEITPLIFPLINDMPNGALTTQQPGYLPSSQHPASTQTTSLSHSTSAPSPTQSPVSPLPELDDENTGTSTSDDMLPVIIGTIIAVTILIVIVTIGLLLLALLLVTRHRKIKQTTDTAEKLTQPPTDIQEKVIEKGSDLPPNKLIRVRSRNNYASTPIYEEINETSVKNYIPQDHEYDYVDYIARNKEKPKNYEVPSPSKSNQSKNSSQEDLASNNLCEGAMVCNGVALRGMETGYDTPLHPGPVETGYDTPLQPGPVETGYDTPLQPQQLTTVNNTTYDTPIDAQSSLTYNTEYSTPIDAHPPPTTTSTTVDNTGYSTPVDLQTIPVCNSQDTSYNVDQSIMYNGGVYENMSNDDR